jgi:hypothetical protein
MYSIDLHALTESDIMALASPIIWHYTCDKDYTCDKEKTYYFKGFLNG